MPWTQMYVRLSELLLWIQETSAPAAEGVAPGNAPAPAADPGAAGKVAAEPSPLIQFAPIIIIGIFFYLILLRPQQKEHKRRQDFLNNLKTNVKVVTSGGLIGTVVNISSDGKVVTLKVDDSTRLRILRSTIQGELEESSESN